MRTVFFLAVMAAVVAALGLLPAGETSATHQAGLVAYWPFDEGSGTTALDAAHGNDGTITGATYTGAAGAAPVPGNADALNFAGATDLVHVPDDALLRPANVTVSAWVRNVGTPTSYDYILAKTLDGGKGSYAFYTGGSSGLYFYVSGAAYHLSDDAGAGVWDGYWHHVVGTYDGSVVRLFVDGLEIGTANAGPAAIAYGTTVFNGDLSIGSYGDLTHPSLDFDWKGDIDEVCVWNRALAPAEITDLVGGGPCLPFEPRAKYHFEEIDTSDITPDGSGNENDGTVFGATLTTAGKLGKGLQFDGQDDYVNVPDNATLDISGDITLEAWVNIVDFVTSSADRNLYIISKDKESNRSYGIGVSPRPELPNTGCGAPAGEGRAFMIAFTSTGIALACGSTPVTTGVYHHIAGTFDSATGTARVYLDGVLDGTAAIGAATINVGSADVQIGARQYSSARGFLHASIDEVCIWGIALGATEIAVHAGGASCDTIIVDIDIKPGSDLNCINPDGHGVIPVAILTTEDFDASTVDPFSVTLEGSGVRVKGKSGNAGSLEDIDGDGDLDLVVQITDDSVLTGLGTATLMGLTFDGTPIQGTDSICIVPPDS